MHLSPITPIPAAQPAELQDAIREEAAALERVPAPPAAPARARSELASAFLLGSAAGTLGVGYVGRRLLLDTIYASPVAEVAIVGTMAATALGVALRWRPARWAARAIGYAVGLNAFWTLTNIGTPSSVVEWFTAGILAVETGLIGLMMNRLGWVEDEEPPSA